MARTTKTTAKSGTAAKGAKAPATKASTATTGSDKTRRADPAGASAVTPVGARAPSAAAKAPVAATATPDTASAKTSAPATKESVAPPAAVPAKAPAERTQPAAGPTKGPGFVPLVLGGLVAGGIGFAVATWGISTPPASTIDPARIDALAADLETLKAAEAPVVDVSGIEAAQAELSTRLDALAARVEVLEAAPTGAAAPAQPAQASSEPAVAEVAPPPADGLRAQVDALGGEITSLRDDLTPRVTALEEGLAEATATTATVEAEAVDLARQSARNQVRLALQSGAPYADPLAVLGDAPEALASSAETGVPAQAALIAAFPDLSRDALRAARSSAPGAGVGSLFQNAFNPRSLEPREGSDADAVLSRAEAAVREGDLATALMEIDALPDEAKAVLDPWISRANARAAALSAADDYLQDG